MKIQFNTDNNITGTEKLTVPLEAMLSEGLRRFSSQITRLEVHLADENGNKHAENDKRCMIEARLEGLKPIAVTNHGNTYTESVEGAINKLITSLDTKLGRLESNKHESSEASPL